MLRKRMRVFISLSICLITLLIGRLVQIQLVSTENFSKNGINLLEASVKQRSQEVVIDHGRGSFIDRNGKSFIYEKIPVLILFPFLKTMDWDYTRVADIVGVTAESIVTAVQSSKTPFAFGNPELVRLSEKQIRDINELEIPGVFAVERKYTVENQLAEQLIGITGQNVELLRKRYPEKELPIDTIVGLTGLEQSFDEFLLSDGKAKLVYHVDGRGGPLFGLNVKYVEPANPFYPVNIKTTLDKDLQQIAEDLVNKHNIQNGGLVLLDIETNSLLALVSRPAIDKNRPYDSKGVENIIVSQQIPGSIFKTVIAAAAIDYELDDEKRLFDCDKTIMGENDQNYQHGMLTFTNSFSRSCNNTFAILGNELKDIDPNIIEAYARKLSLLGPVSWRGDVFHIDNFQQLAEDEGRIFSAMEAKKDRNYVAMSSIGQHEVRVTPLAVANMMATIAKGGTNEMVRASSQIQYKNGATLVDFKQNILQKDSISPYTSMKLQKLLREVVLNSHGTGSGFKQLPYSVAGKSGTAETGVYRGNEQLVNKWFAGYFPFENPKYALVTVNLNVASSEGGVNPLFADMVKALYEFDHE